MLIKKQETKNKETYNPGTEIVKTEVPKVQGFSWLYPEFKASLRYKRHPLSPVSKHQQEETNIFILNYISQ